MKVGTFGMMLFVILIGLVELILTIDARYSRKNELEMAVERTVYDTLKMVNAEENKGCVSDIQRTVKEKLNTLVTSKSQLHITVKAWDPDKGILSLKVRETFTYPIGIVGVLNCQRTAIID